MKKMKELAINGGTPVRDTALPGPYPGASVYGKEEADSVAEVIRRKSPFRYYGVDVAGKVSLFEKLFKEKLGRRHALACSSGTAALILGLIAVGVQPGDKVVIPANTFYATAGAVTMCGGIPIFCDVDHTMNIDPQKLDEIIDPLVKAVVVVPILGNPCKMDEIVAICRKHGVPLVEDAAQSCGSQYKGKYSGTFGDVGTFSLQLNKIISAGEGGILIMDENRYFERAARFHDQGSFREKSKIPEMKDAPDNYIIGQNYRMSEVAGAIASEQIKKLDFIVGRMKEIKKTIKENIRPVLEAKGVEFRTITDEAGDASSTVMMYFPTPEKAIAFKDALWAENIYCSHLYNRLPIYAAPSLMHQISAYANNFPFNQLTGKDKVTYREGMCPVAEDLLSRNVMIPLAPAFTDEDVNDIIEAVKKVAEAIL